MGQGCLYRNRKGRVETIWIDHGELSAFQACQNPEHQIVHLEHRPEKNAVIHQRAIVQLDKAIEQLKNRLEAGFQNRNYINKIELLLKKNNLLEKDKLNALHAAIVVELFEQFQDIATRNGFEMPDNILGG